MGRPRRRGRGHRGPFTGKPDGLQPGDDVGNRRSFKQQQLPPDDLGNRRQPDEEKRHPADDVGNRIDAAPTHEVSGVLADLDGRRRRRKKGSGPQQRMGRYIVGGVNPMVAGNVQRAVEAMKEDEQRRAQQQDGEEGGRGRRRRRRRRDGRDAVDGEAAQEVSQRRAERFFDFEEDDRFDYQLRTAPEDKRAAAEGAVRRVLEASSRDATVTSHVVEDGDKPKVVVSIEDRGAASSLPADARADNADEALFQLGNAALMSLNYLVNKIVNRYPDDRIRLAILPKADEAAYLQSLAEHRKSNPLEDAQAPKAKKNGATAPQTPAVAAASENETDEGETGETPAELEAGSDEAPPAKKKKATAKKTATKKTASASKAAATKKKASASKAAATKKKSTRKAATTKKAAATKKAAKTDEE